MDETQAHSVFYYRTLQQPSHATHQPRKGGRIGIKRVGTNFLGNKGAPFPAEILERKLQLINLKPVSEGP